MYVLADSADAPKVGQELGFIEAIVQAVTAGAQLYAQKRTQDKAKKLQEAQIAAEEKASKRAAKAAADGGTSSVAPAPSRGGGGGYGAIGPIILAGAGVLALVLITKRKGK